MKAIKHGGGDNMMKFDFRKIIYSNILRNICLFLLIIILCSCKKEDGMARGSEENFARQALRLLLFLLNSEFNFNLIFLG